MRYKPHFRLVEATETETIPATSTVEVVDNHVYFYAEVTSDRVLTAILAIRDADSRLRCERQNREIPDGVAPTPIWLHINSVGGDAFAGFAFADMLTQIETPVYSISEGLCASAATLIAMSCKKRFALPNALFLIHQLSGGMWGTHEQFKDELVVQEIIMRQMEALYASRSKLDADALREMLKRDSWISTTKAIEYGIIDGVYSKGNG